MRDWEEYGAIAEYWATEREEIRYKLSPKYWTTKDGNEMLISSMGDNHLMNAYMKTRDKDLFKEMVVRLFNSRLLNKNG
jgi:hypothetical protein